MNVIVLWTLILFANQLQNDRTSPVMELIFLPSDTVIYLGWHLSIRDYKHPLEISAVEKQRSGHIRLTIVLFAKKG